MDATNLGNSAFYFLFNYLFIFGCARSSLLQGLFSSPGEQGLLLVAEHGLLIAVALVTEHGL